MRRPEEERLQSLLLANRILTLLVVAVLLANLFIYFKYFAAAIAAVRKAGTEGKNILQIIDAVTKQTANSFGPLTGKYFIQAGVWSLIALVMPIYTLIRKEELSIYMHWLAMFTATGVAVVLPIDRIYESVTARGQPGNLYGLCLGLMIAATLLASRYLGRHPITRKIARHVIIIIMFGLLALQIFLEG